MAGVFAFGLMVCVFSPQAWGETIIECDGGQGKAFYYDNDPETGAQIGWIDDDMTDGAIVLVINGDSADIIIKDAIGTISASAEGATVTVLDVHEPFVDVLVAYPQGPKELYTFDLDLRRVAWSQHKFGVMFDKAQTFVADCK